MKGSVIICFFLMSIFAAAFCNPVPIDDVEYRQPQEEHVRVKRFTCDVLSIEAKGVKLNYAACGIHCLFLGKRGGWCDNRRVCNCRK